MKRGSVVRHQTTRFMSGDWDISGGEVPGCLVSWSSFETGAVWHAAEALTNLIQGSEA